MEIESLQQELRALRNERLEASGRLHELRNSRGRGRGRGRFGSFGRGQAGRLGRGASGSFGPLGVEQAAPVQKKVLSAVVVDGQERHAGDRFQHVAMKRPAPREVETDPTLRKRNRRIFGSLMGTLRQFCEEDEQFKHSSIAQRRQEALQKAEERSAHESQRLREQEFQNFQSQKQAEIDKIQDLDLQACLKELEISSRLRIRRHGLLKNFIRTQAGPPVHWLPAKHNTATKKLLDQEVEKFDTWTKEELEKLEKDKQEARDNDAEKRKLNAERRAKMAGANGTQPQGKEQPAAAGLEDVQARKKVESKDENAPEDNAEDGELPYDAKTNAEEQKRIEEQIAAEEMAQDDDQDDELPDGIDL
eukprot:evm.model.scf_279.4 EVM.evm.TU.scf_279.4   scf_279:22987-28658(-)